ncbi:MAG: type II secretion system minor pseudopilin GspJ [Gammaproteobacteria bacterium]
MIVRRSFGGFTLLELLVAVAIFTVLGVLAYGGLRNVVNLDAGLRDASQRYERLEFALLVIEQDLRHAAPRSVRDELGEQVPALRAGLEGDVLSLTRHAPRLPGYDERAALARVRYRLDDGSLYRDVWAQLDRTPGTTFSTRRLLDDVAALELRFFADGDWNSFWPPAGTTARGPIGAVAGADPLPAGVAVEITFDSGAQVRRVVARSG